MKLTPCGWAFLRAEPQVGVRKKQTIKHTPNMLRIAIQAKGRLNEQSIDLLSEAGIRVAESKRKLISRAEGKRSAKLRVLRVFSIFTACIQ